MFYGLTASAIAFAAYLLITDYLCGCLNLNARSSRIRLLSMTLLLVLSVLDIIAGAGRLGPESPVVNMACAGSVLLLSPHSYVMKRDYSLAASGIFAAAVSLCAALLLLLGASHLKTGILTFMAVSLIVMHGCLSVRRKFANPKNLFILRAPWHAVEDYAGHCFSILLLSGLCLGQVAASSGRPLSFFIVLPAMVMACGAVYGAYRKSEDSSIVFLTKVQRCHIDNVISGKTVEKKVKTNSRKAAMYSKIQKYMEEKQPYLEERFTISDLAEAMLSNRVYVSKAINETTGDNFNALMNTYRVNHSKKLWNKNPKLKAQELYVQCGFHTAASFINAFKDVTGCTPTEWQRESQVGRLRDKPSAEKLAA